MSLLINLLDVILYTGLAMNSEGNLMLVDTGGSWPPTLITFSQDGQLVRSVPYLPLKGCKNAMYSKLRFMECVGDSVIVIDLGTFLSSQQFDNL